ncbi:MAG: S8 family serine peptidase [Fimbriimonadaceae bacterium]|nr:S8 family serine peptidase [Fimbriimonadaceae bacterium]
MIRKLLLALCALAAVGASAQFTIPVGGGSPPIQVGLRPGVDYIAGEILVKFKKQTFAQRNLAAMRIGARERESYEPRSMSVVRLATGQSMEAGLRYYRSLPNVEYAEPHMMRHWAYTPNDARLNDCWHLPILKAEQAWDLSKGDPNVIVALLDSGVKKNHEDFVGKFVQGKDVVDEDDDPEDTAGIGHGTFCAGFIAPATDNGIGVAGLGFNGRIMPIRTGGFTLSTIDIVEAIDWAVAHDADVLSMSFGGYGFAQAEADAIANAWDAGCVLVAAAGNDNVNLPSYPASFPNVVNVGATTRFDTKADFSNFGPDVDVAAPGERVFSTDFNGGYSISDGTSFSCPTVSGLVSLMLARAQGRLTNQEIVDIIFNTCDPVGDWLTYGRVNAFRAMQGVRELAYEEVVPEAMSMEFGRGLSGGLDHAWANDALLVRVASKSQGRTGQVAAISYDFKVTRPVAEIVGFEVGANAFAKLGVTGMIYLWNPAGAGRWVHFKNVPLRGGSDDTWFVKVPNFADYLDATGHIRVMYRSVLGYRRRGFEPPVPYNLSFDEAIVRIAYEVTN